MRHPPSYAHPAERFLRQGRARRIRRKDGALRAPCVAFVRVPHILSPCMIRIVQLNRSGAASPLALWFAALISTQVLPEVFGRILGALILSVDHPGRICQADIFPRVLVPGKGIVLGKAWTYIGNLPETKRGLDPWETRCRRTSEKPPGSGFPEPSAPEVASMGLPRARVDRLAGYAGPSGAPYPAPSR